MQFKPFAVDGSVSVPTLLAGLDNVMLKLDIEGREFQAFHVQCTKFPDLSSVIMLVVELHDITGSNYTKTVGMLSQISKQMTLFHIHANDYGGYADVDGHRVPKVVELTFVAHRFADGRVPSTAKYPIRGVDECNRRGGTDIPLTFIGRA
jgi:hypothetical protein